MDARLANAVAELFHAFPKDICSDCLRQDPELVRVMRERMSAVGDRINALLLPRLAGEYLRTQILRMLDLADGLVERFRK